MRLTFTSLVFLHLFTYPLFAQANGQLALLEVEPRQVEKSVTLDDIDLDYEDISSVRVRNISDRRLELRYDKVIDLQPPGWRSVVFRRDGSRRPGRDNSFDSGTFLIEPGQTVEFQLIVQPNGQSGEGRIRLPFVDARRPARPLATASFNLSITQRGQQTNELPAVSPSIRVYPNPAVESFFVELPGSERFGRVEVFNTLGRRMRTFNEESGPDGFDIEDLPEGLYLINIYNDRGEKLRTLRLLHPRGGA